MKRTLALVLALVMMMSMAVTAFATASPEDPWDLTPEDPAEVPGVVGGDGNGGCDCIMVKWEDRETLPANKLRIFKDAKETLEDVVPEGYSCREFYYHETMTTCDQMKCSVITSKDPADVAAEVYDGEIPCCKLCEACMFLVAVDDVTEVAAKQYVDETKEWIDLDVVIVEDNLVLLLVADGPVAVFVK